jgi:lysophospholipase L1-like esterase
MSQPTKLIFMGDSITEGQYVDPTVRWTSIVERRLTASSVADSSGLAIINRGVSGETTRQGLERFPVAVQQERPHAVMIQFGMNDCNCWDSDRGHPRVSEKAFVANLAEMIARCRHFEVGDVILATNPRSLRFNRLASGEVYEHANARYSELVREVASEADVTLCDIRAAFEKCTGAQLTSLLQAAPDRLHLTPAGHLFYADACQAIVERSLASVTARSRTVVA